MKLSDFDFSLPEELIAQHPLSERSASRLFCYDRKTDHVKHLQFDEILDIFGPNDVLVLNNSRVIPARIRGDNWEIFLSEPVQILPDRQIWKCLVRKGKFFSEGREIVFPDGSRAIVRKIDLDGLREIEFHTKSFPEFLDQYGEIPLPPYIQEKLADSERYQTVFSKPEGSVAAPTAGLHFTDQILEKLREKGVQIEFVTLHVGLGTFLPVKNEEISEHRMHSEWYSISEDTAKNLNAAKEFGKCITAVGTTALRTLESVVRKSNISKIKALSGKTDLFISPPARFHFVDHLLTNFHLPKSTLLILLAAFLDPEGYEGVQKAKALYQEAIKERYRFFSFGDAMLIL